ncbi:M4 family metallopeptidase [Streptosporangium sp. NPDC004379]|uniref:M4 family metallopeptidase n=1 Tax=Streptosporangium sp. NPDC004379 TaxID=3366189 RepID=UPI00369A3D76
MRRSLISMLTGLLVALSAAPALPGAPALADPEPTPEPVTVRSASDRPASDQPLIAAEPLIEARPEVLHASENDEFYHKEVIAGLNNTFYVPYQRTYKGLPVVGGDFVVVTNASGGVLSTSIAQTEKLNVSTVPKLTRLRASRIARAQLPKVTSSTVPSLVVLARGTGVLAYQVLVTGQGSRNGFTGAPVLTPRKLRVLIDARTGEVLETSDEIRTETPAGPEPRTRPVPPPVPAPRPSPAPAAVPAPAPARSGPTTTPTPISGTLPTPVPFFFGVGTSFYNGPVTVSSKRLNTTYALTDAVRAGVSCGGQNGSAFVGADDSWGDGSGTNLETACVDALYAIGKQWDMLGAWLGRNGYNGSGGGYPARVGLNEVNAYWAGNYANFGRSEDGRRQATSLDIVAHEFGHAVFQNTPGGSFGSNEKAMLNESAGDILAVLTKFYAKQPPPYDVPSYAIGGKADLLGTGPVRYLYKPSLISGHPDCFSPSVLDLESHAGAGVQNHWFYLLAEGSNPTSGQPASPTCNGSRVTGIGIQKAGQIFMASLLRKTDTWTHQLARRATLQAALELFPDSCVEFNAVRDAWDAVNVPAAPGEPAQCVSGNDFDLSVDPAAVGVDPGQRATATVTTRTTAGKPQAVAFAISGLPEAATAAFTPQKITTGESSALSILVPVGTPSGSYSAQILADGVNLDRTVTLTLTVDSGSNVVFIDDFSTDLGWTVNPNGTDTATTGRWERGVPQPTFAGRTPLQLAPFVGKSDLVTGRLAGDRVGANDVDGGVTTIRSREIALPPGTLTMTFAWYFAHLANSSAKDYFRVRVVSPTANTVVLQQFGDPTVRPGEWRTATVNLSEFAGQPIRIVVEAADDSPDSLVEAGFDDLRITRS